MSENKTCTKTDLPKWYEELKIEKNYLLVSRLRSLYNAKNFKEYNINFSDFYNWYLQQKQQCEYCNTTQEEISQLFELGKIGFTRGGRRGRSLEIDRKVSKDSYGSNLNNLVLCCYWCNNAKTDEFSAEEFRPVGIAIGKILKNRLNKK